MQDRADGTNVNNWHWTEKDVSGWARHRLGQLLGGLALFSNESGSAATTTVQSVTGEPPLQCVHSLNTCSDFQHADGVCSSRFQVTQHR